MGFGRWFPVVLGGILCLLLLRGGGGEAQTPVRFSPPETEVTAATTTPPTLELPCVARGSRLIVETLVCYEGDFWEDGSDRYVVDAMALVVYNPGNTMIRCAEITVQQGQRQLRFAVTCLPPNSRVLVLESGGAAYCAAPLTACRCDSLTVLEPASGLTVTPAGPVSVRLHNENDTSYRQVILCCKRYDADSGLYLGGITYITPAGPLAPGETTELTPARYVEGCSRIVCITATS
jgi:hypothetical protein